ncbi:MAG: hypothetical protein N2204_02890 [Anaerolineae bacterium]|nr:hypothetical protein [Anaerolineae bacterium]
MLTDLLDLESSRLAHLLQRMEQEGLVARVERGKYLLLGLEPAEGLSNPLAVASQLVTPSYISFWSALHFYGLTEQAPRTVFVAVTRQKRPLAFQGTTFRFVRLAPHMFFGYRREMLADLPLTVADEAKAILDSLYLPGNAGGVTEVAKALRAALLDDRVEVDQLVEYARRMDNASLVGRLGYLLEQLGYAADLPPPRGPVALDPSRPRGGAYDRRWKVYVNVSAGELFPEGVG